MVNDRLIQLQSGTETEFTGTEARNDVERIVRENLQCIERMFYQMYNVHMFDMVTKPQSHEAVPYSEEEAFGDSEKRDDCMVIIREAFEEILIGNYEGCRDIIGGLRDYTLYYGYEWNYHHPLISTLININE